MDKRFLTAFIAPSNFKLVGFELKPFCIRHMLVLHAVKSPFITRDREPNCVETIQFLRICSAERASIENLKPGFLDTVFAAKLHINSDYHARLVAKIIEYIGEYCSAPRYVRKEKMRSVAENKSMGVPEILTLVTFAMSRLNISEDDALDMPFGRLAWYATAYSIMEGAEIRLISTELEEKAEDDKESILAHEAAMKERMIKAMKDGRVPRRKVRTTSQ